MSDIEQKSMALWNKVGVERGYTYELTSINRADEMDEALCRAIERHEAFRQEVSDAVEKIQTVREIHCQCSRKHVVSFDILNQFIIPKPKPDPLVAALEGVTFDHYPLNDAKTIRAALDALGFEIREKNDD